MSDSSRSQALTTLRPRGSLALPPARELIARRDLPAAYDPDGDVVEGSLRLGGKAAKWRDRKRFPERLPSPEIVEIREEPVVWAGGMLPHFGHFMVESTGRLWPLLPGAQLEGLPAVFASPVDHPGVGEGLDAFGARLIDLPAEGAVRFERMYLPEPAWRLDAWAAPEMRDVHLQIGRNLKGGPVARCDVLWLSRSRLPRSRVAYDECLLEWALDPHVRIVRPEEMTLAEQVGALEAADTVVGVMGSAFHTLLMVSDLPRCVYLCPWADKSHGGGGPIRGAYAVQDRLLGMSSEFMYACAPTGVEAFRFPKQDRLYYPAGHRLLIPDVLRRLDETVLPDLLEDPRAAALARPERVLEGPRRRAPEVEVAAARLMLDPLAVDLRLALGRAFQAEGLGHCALEQFLAAADLADDPVPALLEAARILSRDGEAETASAIGKRLLDIDPASAEAVARAID